MWHAIRTVARNRRCDTEALVKYAGEHKAKYHILRVGDEMEVSTWFVDKLVADFLLVQHKEEGL